MVFIPSYQPPIFMIERINQFLKSFGSNLRNEPIFRLVWSESQFENRYGTYEERHNTIYLRTITKVKLVRKYQIIKERWVLERWIPPELCNHIELPDTKENGSYESIYVFEDENKNYLEPLLIVAEMIMYQLTHPMERGELKAHLELQEEMKDRELEQAVENCFDEESVLADKIKYGEGVSMNFKREN